MDKLVILLVLCCAVVTAYARKPSVPRCISGTWGPACSDYNPCKPGYDCINNRCCLGPVCPIGWTGGNYCNLLPGQEKCPFQYQCIGDFCCRPPQPIGRCPPVVEMKPSLCQTYKPADVCYSNKTCPNGMICCPNYCGFKKCKKPWNFGGPIGK